MPGVTLTRERAEANGIWRTGRHQERIWGYRNGGSGSNGGLTTSIAGGNIYVPARCWKVLPAALREGGPDAYQARRSIRDTTRVIAVDMANTQSANTLEWFE